MSSAWMPAIDQNQYAAILAFGKVAVYEVGAANLQSRSGVPSLGSSVIAKLKP